MPKLDIGKELETPLEFKQGKNEDRQDYLKLLTKETEAALFLRFWAWFLASAICFCKGTQSSGKRWPFDLSTFGRSPDGSIDGLRIVVCAATVRHGFGVVCGVVSVFCGMVFDLAAGCGVVSTDSILGGCSINSW